jgi:hypothetical protein
MVDKQRTDIQSYANQQNRSRHFCIYKGISELNEPHIISTDEDPGLRIENFAVINKCGVSKNKNIICFIAMQTYKKSLDIYILIWCTLRQPYGHEFGYMHLPLSGLDPKLVKCVVLQSSNPS